MAVLIPHAKMSCFLQRHAVRTVAWPTKSPDLSPIEHLWDYLERQVRKRHDVNNVQDLERILRREWDRIPMHIVRNLTMTSNPPGWLSGERVGLMTWWLRVRSPVEATFLSGVFSPLTSAEACEKSSRWLWKEKLC